MAKDFQITKELIKDDFFLIISGDFDGSSAYELINVINSTNPKCKKIIINTNNLNKIYPFGRKIFKSKKHLFENSTKELVFIGEQSKKIAI